MDREITHADQNRTAEFRRLLGQWNVRLAILIPALVMGGGSAITEPLAGLIIFAVIVAIGLGITFWVADSRAGKSFFEQYAGSRGLTPSNEPLGHQTELLRSGNGQMTAKRWDGPLAPDFEGSVAHWSYASKTTDHAGNAQDQWHDFTIVAIPMPALRDRLIEINVNPVKGMERTDRNSRLERLTLESQALDDRYDILVHPDEDQNLVRRLFSPSFIVWLTENRRPFQFGRGTLITATGGHSSSAEAFDNQIAAACEIARKLSAEAQEGA